MNVIFVTIIGYVILIALVLTAFVAIDLLVKVVKRHKYRVYPVHIKGYTGVFIRVDRWFKCHKIITPSSSYTKEEITPYEHGYSDIEVLESKINETKREYGCISKPKFKTTKLSLNVLKLEKVLGDSNDQIS